MAEQSVDLAVLGGGIAGYTAAIRASQLGMRVVLVEKDRIGGTCLHRGCIPSKSLLRSAEMLHDIKQSESYGITVSSVSLDFQKVQERKQRIVEQLYQGLQYLMKKNKIDIIKGTGRISAPSIFAPARGALAVEGEDGEVTTLTPKHLLIATGSHPRMLPGLQADGKMVMTSDDALLLDTLPKSVLIIGGGVIGVEWASMLGDFGVDVTVVEYESRLLPTEDEAVAKELMRLFKKRGIRIVTGAKIDPASVQTEENEVSVQAEVAGEIRSWKAEKLLVSVGRAANVEGIGLENSDVAVERGVVQVNEFYQTAESNIYAVGDVIGGYQLAHAGAHEGITAVEHMAGLHPAPLNEQRIARCVYTRPEVAAVGWTESEAKQQGIDVKVGKFPFKAIGKAHVAGDADGFVKIIADSKSDDIIGVHMIGTHVTDMISEAALAQILDATPWEVSRVVHPHPTLSEALGEAMLSVDGGAIGF